NGSSPAGRLYFTEGTTGTSLDAAASRDCWKNSRYSARVPCHPLPFQVTVHPFRCSTFILVSRIVHAFIERVPDSSSAITVLRTTNAIPAAISVSTWFRVVESWPDA